MEILHLAGHFHKWNLDAHFQNDIGDGFVFCAYSFPQGFFASPKICGYRTEDILEKSFFDLQYFGKREGGKLSKGKLSTYSFHPSANPNSEEETNVLIESQIKRGIAYQIDTLGLSRVIIPVYYQNDKPGDFIAMIKTINKWLSSNRRDGIKYYMTIPLANHTIIDKDSVEDLLYHLTDISIIFDGYYITCEAKPEAFQKISIDFKYLYNLSTVFKVLKEQKFETIYSYANWDALIFLSVTDIDYVTIGTYENLRNFSIKRFTEEEDGGPSKGWYFSEKLLNFVKAQQLDLVRLNRGLDIIKNERNIFSDTVLVEGYPWSNQKPEVHKNYLMAIDRLLMELASESNLNKRRSIMLSKIDSAIEAYHQLELKKIHLTNESKNYHLVTWKSFLMSF
ncbi:MULTISPECIES: hypothetical protein [unclassified Chitinophaga]|uniref:hypothetical protein n=1 Tax=unclassified Chitinophaga TaxID=2619133 RepID=UPI00300FC95F